MWGAIAGAAGTVLGMATQKSQDKRQVKQQQKLTDIQEASNRKLMNESYGLQRDMYDHTYSKNTPEAQMKNLKEAGLNPALMYGIGGQSGATAGGGGASVSGGSAADAASTGNEITNKAQLGLQAGMMEAQIKVLESQAKKNEADAELSTEHSTTESGKRDLLIENMKQEGLARFLDNVERDYRQNQGRKTEGSSGGEITNEKYGWTARITSDSYVMEGLSKAIAETEAKTGNAAAQALLTNEKAQGYWKELLNETMKAEASGKQADNAEIMAKAIKLSSEWDTGEFTNWKTWTELAKDGVNALGNIIGKVSPTGLVKQMAKGK